MKIYTNINNPVTLKLFIAGEFSSRKLECEVVTVDDSRFQSPRRLPVLELDCGTCLFSSNAASRFLFPPPFGFEVDVDFWLEWEAVQLQPAVALCSPSKPSSQLTILMSVLDSALEKCNFLVGDSAFVCDVVLWCCLFPISSDAKLNSEYLTNRLHLSRWFNSLQALPQFQAGVNGQFRIPSGSAALQAMSAACWYPCSSESPLIQQSASPQTPEGPSKDLPVTEVELNAAKEAWENGACTRPRPKVVHHPVLPVANERNVLVTSALPYVNNVPHLGNIIGCVLSADVFARYARLRNWNTVYICGTDEYGTATETKALEEGLSPQQICDKYFEIHREIYEWFGIAFDHFGRTTTLQQTQVVQEMFKAVHNNGFTSTASMEQLLCENCDRYLADRFVEGVCPRCAYEDARGDQCDGCGHLINASELIQPRCKLCHKTPVIRHSQQLFLELPKVEERLGKWLKTESAGWSHNARVIASAWLKDGLKARCITRDLKWGIPVPLDGFEKKVFYVWFDAPIGYLSITKCYVGGGEEWRKWWQPADTTSVQLYQFMAKDNVPFHSIMFPATVMAAGGNFTLVNHLMATEYLNYEDGKFSKSRGVGVFGTDARETGLPADVFRFYLLFVRPESQDSSFSWLDLATKNNSELLNNLGNFVNRALMFADKNYGGRVPEMVPTNEDYAVLALITRELKGYAAALERARLRDGIRHILSISRHGNQFMQSTQPWVLLKGSEQDRLRAGTIIGLCCNIACTLTVLLQPYMPQTAAIMAHQLQAPPHIYVLTQQVTPLLPSGHQIGKPSPLFSKIEQSMVDELKKCFSGRQKSNSPPEVKMENHFIASVALAKMEEAVGKQAALVRNMKESGAGKSEWQPHVTILLEMKKQLATMTSANTPLSNAANSDRLATLEAQVARQAALVRDIKGSGAGKSEWQPHVATLLEMKKQLAAMTVAIPPPSSTATSDQLASHGTVPSCLTSTKQSSKKKTKK